eukprot:TRINITY_DN10941_c0_g1_i1.p1 TRINITY_DN10941_c0_g1~~TRINITY_DN10941_c0_g1_i1.p1  ORF type:complete len:803 (-),score=230.85 TRINITY_DN10941_c0_g1_i1:29-2401(-)
MEAFLAQAANDPSSPFYTFLKEIEDLDEDELRQKVEELERSNEQQGKKLSEKPSGQQQQRKLSRSELIAAFVKKRQQSLANTSPQKRQNSIIFDDRKRSSTRDFKQLKAIQFKDLKPFFQHEGSYLLCRSVTPADTFSTPAASFAQLLVEDTDGRLETLTLYNYIPPLFSTRSSTSGIHSAKAIRDGRPDLDAWLPEGVVLAIKEPYYSEEGIRSESPTDVMIVSSDSELLSSVGAKWSNQTTGGGFPSRDKHSATEWKDLGNKEFASGDNFRAARWYSFGIESMLHRQKKEKKEETLALSPEERSLLSILYSNRALALIRMGHYSEALENAQKSLELLESEKAYFRAGRACYGLREWKKAEDYYQKIASTNEEAVKEIEKIKERLVESSEGRIDYQRLYHESQKTNTPRLDCADYVGPIRSVIDHSKDYKKLVATKAIKPGTLLLCEKAFSIVYDSECVGSWEATNLMSGNVDKQSQVLVSQEMAHQLLATPERSSEVYSIYAGPNLPRSSSSSSSSSRNFVDVQRLEPIVTFNAFQSQPLSAFHPTLTKCDKNTGVWIIASGANHSCVANAERSFIGDILFLHAIRRIEEGEEITHTYVDPAITYEQRRNTLRTWGVDCKCKLCELDKEEKNQAERSMVMLEFDAFLASVRGSSNNNNKATTPPSASSSDEELLSKGEAFVSKLRDLYTRKHWLVDVYTVLALMSGLFETRNPDLAVDLGRRSLEALGIDIEKTTVEDALILPMTLLSAVRLANLCAAIGIPSEKFMRLAKRLDVIGDDTLFDVRFKL